MSTNINNFYRGDTLTYKLTFTDENGNPLDLTGATVYFTVKSSPDLDDSAAEIQVIETNHVDPVNGITQINVPASLTANLIPNTSYYYDFQLKDAAGNVKTLLSGKVKVLQDITRSI